MPAQPNDKLRNTPSNASVPDEEVENGADDASFSPYSEEMPEYGNGGVPDNEDADEQMRAEQLAAAQEAAAAAELDAARARQRQQIAYEEETEELQEYSGEDTTALAREYAKQRAKDIAKKAIKRRVMMYVASAIATALPFILIIGLAIFCVIFLSILVENAATAVTEVPSTISNAITSSP